MNIEQSNVRKIKVTDILKSHSLDPISIYLEDYELGKGKITISCWDKSWHSYWGGMGNRTISQFFLSCDNGYLAKNLSSVESTVYDYDKLRDQIFDYYHEDIDYFLQEELNSMSEDADWESWLRNEGHDVMVDVFGEEWWYDLPTMANPKYKYLCRIIDTVKEVLKTISFQESTEQSANGVLTLNKEVSYE